MDPPYQKAVLEQLIRMVIRRDNTAKIIMEIFPGGVYVVIGMVRSVSLLKKLLKVREDQSCTFVVPNIGENEFEKIIVKHK